MTTNEQRSDSVSFLQWIYGRLIPLTNTEDLYDLQDEFERKFECKVPKRYRLRDYDE